MTFQEIRDSFGELKSNNKRKRHTDHDEEKKNSNGNSMKKREREVTMNDTPKVRIFEQLDSEEESWSDLDYEY